jgi:hypothetical protein
MSVRRARLPERGTPRGDNSAGNDLTVAARQLRRTVQVSADKPLARQCRQFVSTRQQTLFLN